MLLENRKYIIFVVMVILIFFIGDIGYFYYFIFKVLVDWLNFNLSFVIKVLVFF